MISLTIGYSINTDGGGVESDYDTVEFEGKLLGSTSILNDPQSNDRGEKQALYKTSDGRLIVFIDYWTQWQGETCRSQIIEVKKDDLSWNGPYERLGKECGFATVLSLDQALDK